MRRGALHLGGPVDAVGLLAGLGAQELGAAGAGAHVLHGVHRQRGLGALPVQHRKAAAPRLPTEVHHLVISVGQLQHLQRAQAAPQRLLTERQCLLRCAGDWGGCAALRTTARRM